jgi:hypothetical protein
MMMARLTRISMRRDRMTKELARIRRWKKPRMMVRGRSLPLTKNRRLLLWTRHCLQGGTTTKTLKKSTSTEQVLVHLPHSIII